jgi:hypothetical protein
MVDAAAGVRFLIIGAMCMTALATWALLGSLLPANLKGEKSTIERASAIALVGFAVLLLGSVVRPFVVQQPVRDGTLAVKSVDDRWFAIKSISD